MDRVEMNRSIKAPELDKECYNTKPGSLYFCLAIQLGLGQS